MIEMIEVTDNNILFLIKLTTEFVKEIWVEVCV